MKAAASTKKGTASGAEKESRRRRGGERDGKPGEEAGRPEWSAASTTRESRAHRDGSRLLFPSICGL